MTAQGDHDQITVKRLPQAVLPFEFLGGKTAAIDVEIFQDAVPQDETKHQQHAENGG